MTRRHQHRGSSSRRDQGSRHRHRRVVGNKKEQHGRSRRHAPARQALPQQLARTAQAPRHCPVRSAQQRRDLFLAAALDVMQDQRQAVLFRQRLEFRVE